MTTVAAAIARREYELVALRLVLGVAAALRDAQAGAPQVRDELVTLLSLDPSTLPPFGRAQGERNFDD
jgi:hypothetical protein